MGGHEYEFGGPLGVFGMMIGLPVGIWSLFLACNIQSDGCVPPLVTPDFGTYTFFKTEAMVVVIGWMAWLALLWAIVPGQWCNGAPLPDGTRLEYKLNGFSSMLISFVALGAGHYYGMLDLIWLHDNQLPLATASIIFSAVLSVYLYAIAKVGSGMKCTHGDSGHPLYDFFIGHELNPRIGVFDLKVFCELRPGLIGWSVLNAAMLLRQYQDNGTVDLAMWMVNIFQLVYVVDALWYESAILTTMDVTTDGFGYMLAFGDLAWVPFTYGLQARFLAFNRVPLSYSQIALIIGVGFTGYYIFRSANGQKNLFRSNPNDSAVKHLKTLPTERGTKLLVDGWWGTARHINYFGDWLMAWAWCLTCGFSSVIPYFYVIYFAGLLIHREMRDELGCRLKYGKDWDKYCKIAKYRIIPYVY